MECCVGAVSKMLRSPGDRVKTDGRDAAFLARMLAVGNVVEVSVPASAMEAARDLAPVASALSCLRGIPTVTAFSIATEAGDFSRFATARSFMSCLGLVPPEGSSGESVSRGKITRAGNPSRSIGMR